MKTPQEHHEFSLLASNAQEPPGRVMTVAGADEFAEKMKNLRFKHQAALGSGELGIFDPPVPCAVLPGGVRALSARGTMRALTGGGAKDGHLGQFLARISSDSGGFRVGPITWTANGGVHREFRGGPLQMRLGLAD